MSRSRTNPNSILTFSTFRAWRNSRTSLRVFHQSFSSRISVMSSRAFEFSLMSVPIAVLVPAENGPKAERRPPDLLVHHRIPQRPHAFHANFHHIPRHQRPHARRSPARDQVAGKQSHR